MQKKFELVFHGPKDDSKESLDAMKDSLVTDLGLGLEEASNLLANYPITLSESTERSEIEPLYQFLESINAKVEIKESLLSVALKLDSNLAPITETNELPLSQEEESSSLEFNETEQTNQTVEIPVSTQETSKNDTESASQADDFEFSLSFEDNSSDSSSPGSPTVKIPAATSASESLLSVSETTEISLEATTETEEELSLDLASEESESGLTLEPSPDEPVVTIEEANNNDEIFAELDDESSGISFESEPEETNPPKKIESSRPSEAQQALNATEDPGAITVMAKSVGRSKTFLDLRADNKMRFKASKALEYLIPIGIGIAIILVSAKMIFPSPEIENTKANVRTAKVAKKPARPVERKTVHAKFSGENEVDELKTKAFITTTNLTINNARIEISPPPPEILTPEDVVRNRTTPPWIDNIIIESLKFTKSPKEDEESFLGLTKTRLYVSLKNEKIRVVVPVAARAAFIDDGKKVKLAVLIKHGYKKVNQNENFKIEVDENDRVSFFIRANLIADIES